MFQHGYSSTKIAQFCKGLNGYSEIPTEKLAWLNELDLEICRSIRNEPPRLSWVPLKSAFQDIDWWVCPVINEINYQDDGSAELRVYMYRMDQIDNIEKNIFKRMFMKQS